MGEEAKFLNRKDAFERLGLKRAAALDEEQLQAIYAEKSREAHPDHGGSEDSAAGLNDAYETLRQPELRLKHLLELAGPEEAKHWRTVPLDEGMMSVFGRLGSALQKANETTAKQQAAQSALAKALLAKQVLQLREELEAIGFEVVEKRSQMEKELPGMDVRLAASQVDVSVWRELAALQARFAYLAKWQKQIREALLNLTID